jgi:hypothetical protein
LVRSTVNQFQFGAGPSIGIVSPFREHVDAIREQLVHQFSSEVVEKHAIVVGTAHAMQGDEKDLVIFSTSIDPQSHPASLRFLENRNLFNVAVTRPRKKLIVVTSVHTDELPAGLLRDFLLSANIAWSVNPEPEPSKDELEREVALRLQQQQVDVWPGFRSAGKRINVVAVRDQDPLAILCDSSQGDGESARDALLAQRRLARAGWKVTRLPHRTWVSDWYTCCESIVRVIGSHLHPPPGRVGNEP